jgi:phosphoribosylformylglycinamidine cyclo-ligase
MATLADWAEALFCSPSRFLVPFPVPYFSFPAPMAATYKDAGVDLDVYAESMSRLPRLMHRTFSPRVIPSDGGFAGLFQLDFAGKLFSRNYQEPVLISGTDGVGTKLKIAQTTGRHETVGIDLVGMCVNDLLCTGGEPLFFLDYVAMGKDDPARLEKIVQGISDGCVAGDMALLGGETAIMPDMYGKDDYDLAGFAVGVVEKRKLIDGKLIGEGDVVLGLASNGLHSNGFSLVRKIIDDAGLSWDSKPEPFGGRSLADVCLEPTRIYTNVIRGVQSHYRVKQVLHGIAHITGGGVQENLDRILPKNVDALIEPDSWALPQIFQWLQKTGDVQTSEMRRVFNMGLGLAIVVSDFYAASVKDQIQDLGIDCFPIGRIVSGEGKVRYA